MKYFWVIILCLMSGNVMAQTQQYDSVQQKNAQDMRNNPLMQMSRSLIKSSGDQRKAYNLLVLQDVATYKLGDETLQKEIFGLQNNQEYYRKLELIRKKLSNAKIADSKNKEIMRILDEAGNRIVNLMGN